MSLCTDLKLYDLFVSVVVIHLDSQTPTIETYHASSVGLRPGNFQMACHVTVSSSDLRSSKSILLRVSLIRSVKFQDINGVQRTMIYTK